MFRHVVWIKDFVTTVGCGRHQKVPFECSKVLLILEDGVLGDFSFDDKFEVHKMLSIGIGFWLDGPWCPDGDVDHGSLWNY